MNIYLLTRKSNFFARFEGLMAEERHRVFQAKALNELPVGAPNHTIDLVVLDVDFSPEWAGGMRTLTGCGLKVVVVSANPTSKETRAALALAEGGTAMDYLDMYTEDAQIITMVRSAFDFQPRRCSFGRVC